ncbi:hypothetical protein PHYPSEUDO_009910 [Phytophthora pseudosyringae]|uniref:HSF-type DNA-binding domain-containing protein n=1 Tax=Phytophthora pseudosyringae TaxID=221518 RepID=A0A8T1VB78_9STRA|nr:hypothetical protein PHYPSEUDO_009910 [Phytophthora pseudosyringae]
MDTSNANTNSVRDAAFATVPRFVRSVYDMLQHEDQRILSWSADGSHFQVYDVPRLETAVLRKYFKHGKFSSFQRQLNNFGFHKWTKTRASVATFSHDVLVRCPGSELAALVGQMKPKQNPTATAATPVKATTSAKRPRSLLSTTTATEHTTALKKCKMSPRDVCAVDDLSDVSFASILEPLWVLEDVSYGSKDDVLLVEEMDSVDVLALDWDAFVSPLETPAYHSNRNSNSDRISDIDCISDIDFDTELDFGFELDCAASYGLLTEADVSAVLGGLETAQACSDCELDVLLADVDTLFFV